MRTRPRPPATDKQVTDFALPDQDVAAHELLRFIFLPMA
jgi:hypothetical protein